MVPYNPSYTLLISQFAKEVYPQIEEQGYGDGIKTLAEHGNVDPVAIKSFQGWLEATASNVNVEPENALSVCALLIDLGLLDLTQVEAVFSGSWAVAHEMVQASMSDSVNDDMVH